MPHRWCLDVPTRSDNLELWLRLCRNTLPYDAHLVTAKNIIVQAQLYIFIAAINSLVGCTLHVFLVNAELVLLKGTDQMATSTDWHCSSEYLL